MMTASTEGESLRPLHGRRESRISARFEVSVCDPSGAVFRTEALNLSLGGLCLESRQPFPRGLPLRLEIALGAEPMALLGRVAWNRPDQATLGVHFVDLTEETERRLETVIWLFSGLAA